MTRTRNSAYQGVSIFDALPDATAFAKCLRETAQDFHLLYDRMTGSNSISAADTMTHDGTPGCGSLLGVPVVNQYIQRRIGYDDADASTYGGDTIILGVPLFVSTGEAKDWRVEVDTDVPPPDTLIVDVYDSTGTLLATVPASAEAATGGFTINKAALPEFASTGAVVYLLVRHTFEAGQPTFLLRSWRVYTGRTGEIVRDARPGTSAGFPVPTAASSSALTVETLHDEYFAADFAVAGHVVNKLNRNLNAAWEYLTGAPVPGNASTTNADSGSVAPADYRAISHTRQDFAAEPMVDFPVACLALGAVRTDGTLVIDASAPTEGMVDWAAPFPVDTSTSTGMQVPVYMPDFPSSGADCSLKCSFLVANDSGKAAWTGNWQLRCTVGGTASAWATLTQLGSTNLYAGTASFSSWTGADTTAAIALQSQLTSGSFTLGEMSVLGFSVHFAP